VADGLALGDAEVLHDRIEAVAGEDPQQVVLTRQVEFREAGVALTAGPAAQLVVDPAALVALGAEDEQTAGGFSAFVASARRSRPSAKPLPRLSISAAWSGSCAGLALLG
jgi:hypothetical protein